MTRRQAIAAAAARLRQAGIDQAWFEAQLLLSTALGIDTVEIIAHGEVDLAPHELEKYNDVVTQRQQRKPLAYIIGKKPFLNWEFYVDEGVLIPRPETELLVELAIEKLRGLHGPLSLADIGTGSGAIGLSMLKLLPQAKLVAVDISPASLTVAGHNAQRLKIRNRVTLLQGDLLEPLKGWPEKFHCITANLPYIPLQEYIGLQPEITQFEAETALVSGIDGLEHYRRLLPLVPTQLRPGGLIFVEIGKAQAGAVAEIFRQNGFRPTIEKDLAGHPRIVWAKI